MCRILIYGCQAVVDVERETTEKHMKTTISCGKIKIVDLREGEISDTESEKFKAEILIDHSQFPDLHHIVFCVKEAEPKRESESDKPEEEFVEMVGMEENEECVECDMIRSSENESLPEAIDGGVCEDFEEQEENFEPAKPRTRSQTTREHDSEAYNVPNELSSEDNESSSSEDNENDDEDFDEVKELEPAKPRQTRSRKPDSASKAANASFKCPKCGKIFKTRQTYGRHLKTHLKSVYTCEICSVTFEKLEMLYLHMDQHITAVRTRQKNSPKDVMFECYLCLKIFSSSKSRYLHQKIHGEKKYKCHICDKAFLQKYHINRHMVVHTGEKKYKCHICGKAFVRKYHINRHMVVHTGEKKYKCHICDKAFGQKSDAKRHVLYTHTGEKRFKCNFCDKAFVRKDVAKEHMARHLRNSQKRKK